MVYREPLRVLGWLTKPSRFHTNFFKSTQGTLSRQYGIFALNLATTEHGYKTLKFYGDSTRYMLTLNQISISSVSTSKLAECSTFAGT